MAEQGCEKHGRINCSACADESELTRLRADVARLRAALKSLRNETSGMLGIADTEMRAAVGHSNVACLYLRIAEADAALEEGQDG